MIFFSRKKPTQRFSWILVLVFLPVVGLIVYSVMGSDVFWDYKRRKIRQRHRAIFLELDAITRRWHNRSGAELSPPSSSTTNAAAAFSPLIIPWRCSPTAGRNSPGCLRILGPPKTTSTSSISPSTTMRWVRNFCHSPGKGPPGVEVKLLYDSFGCGFTFVRPLFQRLKEAGGRVQDPAVGPGFKLPQPPQAGDHRRPDWLPWRHERG